MQLPKIHDNADFHAGPVSTALVWIENGSQTNPLYTSVYTLKHFHIWYNNMIAILKTMQSDNGSRRVRPALMFTLKSLRIRHKMKKILKTIKRTKKVENAFAAEKTYMNLINSG